jgi:prolyl oligopeptidase
MTRPIFFSETDILSLPSATPGNSTTAYGGFAWSQLPTFTPFFTSFVHSFSGIVAVANVRGGGEYGLDWHRQARARGKQKSYDDMIAAGRWLREQSWCGSLTVHGSSNGTYRCGPLARSVGEALSTLLTGDGFFQGG